jgi:predicted MPP superfamily phosphohydrolase
MHGGPFDEHHEHLLRRNAWRARREAMEAQPSGKRWRGRMRSYLYHTARRTHDVLRPTLPVQWGAARALRLEVTELTVSFADLPAAFDGYRILHLTDLHLDNIDGTAEAVAERVADVDSDLCVVTGDIRDNIHAPMGPLMKQLDHVASAVQARDGMVGVLGNHDSAAMVPPMEALGIRVLLNETVSYGRGQDTLHVTGVDDVHRFRTEDAQAALQSAPDGFCIALVHSPEAAHAAAVRHRLYLTGHTHGGQICIPGGRPVAYGMKGNRDLARGIWQCGDMVGYTSRGLGACVLPFRSFCPGEVVSVTLRRASGDMSGDGTTP